MNIPSTDPDSEPRSSNVYGDPHRVMSIFTQFIVVTLLGLGAGIIINLAENDTFAAAILGICAVPVLASLYFVRHKLFEIAATFLAVVLISLITIVVTNGEGIHQISVLSYPAVLVVASLVVRKRTMVFLTLYIIACVAWLIFGEYYSIYTPDVTSRSTLGEFVIAIIILGSTAIMVRLLTETLFQNNLQLQMELKERKLAEQALRESEDRYKNFIAQSFEAIMRTEFDEPVDVTLPTETQIDLIYENAYLAECNQAMADMYHIPSPQAFIGMRLIDAHGGKDNPINRAAFRKLIENGYKSNNDETIEYTADGKPIWLLNNTIGRVENGRLVRLWGTAIDITERKQVEKALQESEHTAREFQEKLRALHDVSLELSSIESLDELYHDAVEMGVRKLGFERLALFLIEENGKYLAGTYGTDEKGHIRDEHHVEEEINENKNKFILDWLRSQTRSAHLKNVKLQGAGQELDKEGSNVLAIVWDGNQAIGMLASDNYLSQSPPEPFTEDLLSMYGNVIGHLITRIRNEQALHDSEERYRIVTELMSDYIFRLGIDPNGKVTIGYLSENYAEITGRTLDQVKSTEAWSSIIHPEDIGLVINQLSTVIATRESGELECRSFVNDGKQRWIHVVARPVVDQNSGTVTEIVGSVKDITERKRVEEALFAEKERVEITLQSIGDAVITTDIHARVEYLNPVAENLTGWKVEEAVGQPLENVFQIIEEGSRQPAINPVERCLREGKVVGLANHSILISRDGREFAIDDSAAPIRNRQGEITGVVLVFHDVTEARRLSQKLEHDAMHDSLTGLVNRREFERRLERALISMKKYGLSHILCYLDLDQFKIVNDTAGHTAGDELLKQVAGMLSGLFRQRDTFARLGGDEFGLLLENCQLDQALVIANEILTKVHGLPFVWERRSFQVGVSIGVVSITEETESVEQLLSQADIACYSAKDLGRDRIHVYQIEDSETTRWHNDILQAYRTRDALINEQFRLYCQPIARLTGDENEIIQYEVLLRMQDGDEHLRLPGAFIPSAERYGLMPAIDRWVIRETLLIMAKYDIHGKQIAINLSGNSLDDETLLEYVLEQLYEYSIPLEQICFEITETAAIHHLSQAQQFIRSFRELGGKIALDDFGSGFSSFRYLKTLPVDYIKIDGGFVSDMLSSPGDLATVKAINQIAHTLGIEVIAEHASDLEIINRLREIGVDLAQGFGIGHPIPVEVAWEARKK